MEKSESNGLQCTTHFLKSDMDLQKEGFLAHLPGSIPAILLPSLLHFKFGTKSCRRKLCWLLGVLAFGHGLTLLPFPWLLHCIALKWA